MKWYREIALKFKKSTIHHEKNNTIVDEIEIIKQCNIDEGYVFFNCMLRDIKIGYLYLTRYDGESIKLADIFVFDNYRNIGIGSKLLEEAIKFASLLEIKFIYGVICGEEKKLQGFYQSFGFEVAGKNIKIKLKSINL